MVNVATRMARCLVMGLLCLIGSVSAFAQTETLDASVAGYAPATLVAGGLPGTFSVLVKTSTVSISGYKLKVTMPAGMEYVPVAEGGSLTGLSETGGNITNRGAPVLVVSNITAPQSLQVSLSVRIVCGYTQPSPVTGNGLTFALYKADGTTVSAIAVQGDAPANAPQPGYAITNVNPTTYSTQLNTTNARTLTIKNSANVAVDTVYIESTVTTASQASSYKVVSAGSGTVSAITNGYRVTLKGAALQAAITTGNGDAHFDPGETITIALNEQMASCASGSSIALALKAGSGDTKANLCFYDNANASLTGTVGNPALGLRRINGTTSFPDFCNNGTTSFMISNRAAVADGAASALYKIRLAWGTLASTQGSIGSMYNVLVIKKVSIGGTDVTATVMAINGSGAAQLVPGANAAQDVVDLSRLTSAAGVLHDVDGDGSYGDLLPGDSVQVDFEYGFNMAGFNQTYPYGLNKDNGTNTSDGYFALGTFYYNQCGSPVTKLIYPATGSYTNDGAVSPVFQIAAQYNSVVSSSISSSALFPGDHPTLTVNWSFNLQSAFTQNTTINKNKIVKSFTVTLPPGLYYDNTQKIYYNTAIPTNDVTAYTVASADKKTVTVTLDANVFTNINTNDVLIIPLTVVDEPVTNTNVNLGATFGYNNCPGTTQRFGYATQAINYNIISPNCATVSTSLFSLRRATFGYVPDPSGNNVFYRPTAYVNENTPGINLAAAVSKDSVKFALSGGVNSAAFTELWAKVQYTPAGVATTLAQFDSISAAATVVGTLTVKKASDGSLLSTDVLRGDVVKSYDAVNAYQVIQINVGSKIGSGKAINYDLGVGDSVFITWYMRVNKSNLPNTKTLMPLLQGQFYTKDASGTVSNCSAYPVAFTLQNLVFNFMYSSYNGTVATGTKSQQFKFDCNYGNNPITSGGLWTKESRVFNNFRSFSETFTGTWTMDPTAGKTYFTASGVTGSYALDPSLFTVTYAGGNTTVSFSNPAFDANGFPAPTGLPVYNANSAQGFDAIYWNMIPVCVPSGNMTINITAAVDNYTSARDNSNVESATLSNVNYAGVPATKYVGYSANAAPTLQNVDGIGSTVSWQVQVANTSDVATLAANSASTSLPNNWLGFVSPRNNIIIQKVTDIATNTDYPAVSYGAGKYWVKVGDIASTKTYAVTATYTTCTTDSVQYTYSFATGGYPVSPDDAGTTCNASQSQAWLRLYPKDVNLTMTIASPANPVQFCTNTTPGENPIVYQLTVTNTATANAGNLVMEAAVPSGFLFKPGSSKLTWNSTTTTLGDPVYNSAKGVWQWNISADPNGIASLPGAAGGNNSYVLAFQGQTQCGFTSGSAIGFHAVSSTGCGQVRDYSAAGAPMTLGMVPSSLNAYYIVGLPNATIKTDGAPLPYTISFTNQGPGSSTAGETVSIIMPKGVDVDPNSVAPVTNAANVTGVIADSVMSGTNNRIVIFQMPGGANGSTLAQNETGAFQFNMVISDPSLLSCSVTETLQLSSAFSVAGVQCAGSPCTVSFITGSATSNLQVVKSTLAIAPAVTATSVYSSATNESVTVTYKLNNTGTIAGPGTQKVIFYNDANSNGIYDAGDPILYSQTVTGSIAAGAASATQTATFAAGSNQLCKLAIALLVSDNPTLCADANLAVPTVSYTNNNVNAFSVCEGTNVSIGAPAISGVTYSWAASNYLSAANTANPTFNFPLTGIAAQQQYTYTQTATRAGGCYSTYAVTVTVKPSPVVNLAAAPASCPGASVDLSALTTGSINVSTYSYLAADGTTVLPSSIVAPAATTSYNIRGTAASGCVSALTPVTITVNPRATAASITATDPAAVCAGSDVTMSASSAIPAAVYNWYTDAALTTKVYTGNPYTPSPALTASATFYVTVSGTGYCENAPNTGKLISATVSKQATAADITLPTPAAICSGAGVSLAASSTTVGAPQVFNWYSDAALSTKVNTGPGYTPTPNLTATTTYYVTVSGPGVCANTAAGAKQVTVTVNRQAVAADITVSDPAPVCSGSSVSINATTALSGATFKWYSNAGLTTSVYTGNPYTFTPAGSGSYYITASGAGICENAAGTGKQVNVTVNTRPAAGISGTASICPGTSASFNVTLTGTAPWSVTYTDGTGSTTVNNILASPYVLNVTPAANTTYSLTAVSDANCTGTASGSASVTLKTPVAAAIAGGALSVCTGKTSVAFTGNPSGGTWSIAPTAIATIDATGAVTGVSVGSATITYNPPSVCAQPGVTATISVVAPPATPVISGASSVCVGTLTALTGTPAGGNWSSSNTAVATVDAAGNVSALSAGSATITYTVSNGACGTSTAKTVTVNSNATAADITLTNPAATCSGSSVSMTASSATATAPQIFNWYSDAALTTKVYTGPTYTPSPAVTTDYYVTVSGANLCANTAANAKKVTAVVNRHATNTDITASDPAAICSGSSVTMSVSSASVGAPQVFNWYSDAALTTKVYTGPSYTPSPAPAATTSYYVTVSGNGVCENLAGAAQQINVTVNPQATDADIQLADPAAICSGSTATLLITGSDITNPAYNWYSDAALQNKIGTGVTLDVSPTVTTSYYATVSGDGACANAAYTGKGVTVTVNRTATAADISANAPAPVCNGTSVTLAASSTTVPGGTFRWYQDAGLQQLVYTGDQFTVAPSATTTYYVTVSGSSVCENDDNTGKDVQVVVNRLATAADITAANPPAVCTGTIESLAASSTIPAAVYNWYTDPALTNNVYTGPSYQVTATANTSYYVTVQGTGVCANAANTGKRVQVSVNVRPTATLSGAAAICAGSTANLQVTFTGTAPWSIVYTDGSASQAVNGINTPNYTLNVSPAANATYTLLAVNDANCTGTVSGSGTVTTQPVVTAAITGGATAVCAGSTSAPFIGNPAGGAWSIAPTTTATIDAGGIVTGISAGTATITYAPNVACAQPSVTTTINVVAALATPVISGGNTLCIGSVGTLSASVAGGNWATSDAGIVTVNNAGTISGVTAGTATITYTITNGACANTATYTVTVNGNAAATDLTVTTSGPVCSGTGATLTAASTTIAAPVYNWYTDAALTSKVFTGKVYTPASLAATTTYYVTVSGTGVCENMTGNTAQATVTVQPRATDADIVTTTPVYACPGQQVVLSASSNTLARPVINWYTDAALTNRVSISPVYMVTPTANTDYYVTVFGRGTCENAASTAKKVSVIMNRTATSADITVSNPAPVCAGGDISMRVTSSVAAPVYNWYTDAALTNNVHTGPTYTPAPAPAVTTTYYVTVSGTNVCGNAANAAAQVVAQVNQLPATPVAGNDGPQCVGNSIHLSAVATGSVTYNWTGPNNYASAVQNPVLTNTDQSQAGVYSVVVTDANSCVSAPATTTVAFNARPTGTPITGATTVCNGATIPLANSTAGGTWLSANTAVATVDNNGNVTGVSAGQAVIKYTIANATGCTDTSMLTITVNALPVVATTALSPVCEPGTLDLTQAILNYNLSQYSYVFRDPTGSIVAVPASVRTGGAYTVVATENRQNGCTSLPATINATVNSRPVVQVTTLAPVCAPATVSLVAAITNYDAATYDYLFTTAAGVTVTNPAAVTVSDGYKAFATSKGTLCRSDVASIPVTINAQPVIALNNNGNIQVCGTGTANLTTAIAGYNTATYTYTFTNAQNQPVANAMAAPAPGVYSVTATGNATQCTSLPATITVAQTPLPTVVINNPAPVMYPATVDITAGAVTLGSTANLVYTYYDSLLHQVSQQQAAAISGPGVMTYYIQGATATGCLSAQMPVTVTIRPSQISGNKLLTPDGDGINDRLVFPYLDSYGTDNRLQLFDKAGKLIYDKKGYSNDFNGIVNGKPLANDTYYYILTIQGKVVLKSFVTIVHLY